MRAAGPGFFDKTKEDVDRDRQRRAARREGARGRVRAHPHGRRGQASRVRDHASTRTASRSRRRSATTDSRKRARAASPARTSSTKKTFDGKTVEGRYKSAKPHEFFGNTYAFDVSFKADITRKAKPVPPTAAETAAAQKSPQAKVYVDFLNAVQKEDLGAMRKLMTKEQAKNLDSPDAKKMVGMIKMMSATDIKVLKVVEKGDTAELTVAGKQDGKDANGIVHMVKEDGAWKVQREEWKN